MQLWIIGSEAYEKIVQQPVAPLTLFFASGGVRGGLKKPREHVDQGRRKWYG